MHHQLKPVNHLNQQQQLQQQQQSQQNRKTTVNMLFDADKNRILYTNFKNNRGQPIFASVNAPKVVNLLPMQNKNNVAAGSTTSLQGIVTTVPTVGINKNQQTVQRIATIANAQTISQLRHQQQQHQLLQQQQQQQQHHQLTGIVSGGISVVGASVNSVVQSTNNSSGGVNISSDALNKIIHNNDGTTAIAGININTTNR